MAVTLQELLVRLGLDAGDFGTGMDAAMSKTTSFGSHVDNIVDKILSPAGMIGALAAIGATAFSAAEMLDESFDTITTRTGATGVSLDALKASFKAVYANVPSDAAAVTEAISGLNVKLGLTGQPLEDLAGQFLNLSRITGTDAKTAIDSVTSAFNSWGIEAADQGETLDALFRTFQATGTPVNQLADNLSKFGPLLRQMGLDFQTSAALLGQFQQEGINTDRVVGALNIALGNMAKVGITDSGAALQILTDQIKNAGSASEANRIAIEVFGSKAGPQMASAIREGRFEIDGLIADLNESGVTINATATATDDFGERWKTTWHSIQLVLAPVGEALRIFLDFAIQGLGRLIEWATPVFTFLIGGLEKIGEWLGKIPGMSKVFADSGGDVKDLAAQIASLKTHTTKQIDATDDLKVGLGKLNKEGLKKAEEATKDYEKELKDWEKTAKEAEKAAGDNWSALYKLREETKKAQDQTALFEQGLIRVGTQTSNYIDDAYALRDSLSSIESAARGVKDMMPPFSTAISDAIGLSSPQIGKLSTAMATLGLDSIAAKQQIATQMAAARDEVLGSTVATDFEKKTAIYKALNAQIEAAKAAGLEIPKEQLATLTTLETDLKLNLPTKLETPWSESIKRVSTAITNAAQSMVGILIGTEEGSIMDAFKKLGLSFFTEFTEKAMGYLNDFIELGIKKLIGWLLGETGLDAAFKSIGQTISGVFGGTSGGGGTSVPTGGGPTPTPDDTGGGGGVPGGGGSSGMQDPLAWVNAIANTISAIWNIRQEGTLNAIEHEVRFSQIHLLSILDKVNAYLPKLNDIHDRWIEYLRDHAWRIHDVWEVLCQIRDDIRYDLMPPIRLMASAGPVVNVYVTLDGKALTSSVMTEVADTLRSGGQQL